MTDKISVGDIVTHVDHPDTRGVVVAIWEGYATVHWGAGAVKLQTVELLWNLAQYAAVVDALSGE